MLAFVLMIENTDLDEAISTLKKGLSYNPGNQHSSLLMAQIYLRQEKFAEAHALAERLSKTADDEGVRHAAEQVSSTVTQYQEARRNSELVVSVEGMPRPNRPPVLLKRETVSDAEFAKIERDREVRNLNIALGQPGDGQKRIVGKLAKIDCSEGEVVYDLVADGSKLRLTSKDFQSLDLVVLHEGTSDISIGCEAQLADELAVFTYRQDLAKNILTSVHFVPADFRLMTADEIRNAPTVIIQGGPPSDTTKNSQIAAEQMAEFEKRRGQMMMQQLESSLRKPQDGEIRVMGGVEKIDCTTKDMFFVIKHAGGSLRLKSPPPGQLQITTFTPDAGGLQFGCGTGYPALQAIVTYRPIQDKKGKHAGDLVALEYVPRTYQLPASN